MTDRMTGFSPAVQMTPADYSGRRRRIFLWSLLLHIAIFIGPLGWYYVRNLVSPPKPNAFRVKIGGRELSHGPVVGPPERLRPGAPQPPAKTPPKQPAVPQVKPQPKQPSVPKIQPKPAPKKVPAKPSPRAKTPARPTKKSTGKAKNNPKQPAVPVNRRPRNLEEAQQQVYRPPRGTNNNPMVPIGNRDAAQALGPADHRTPGGGASEEMEKYGKRLILYLKTRWHEPPKSLLGNALPAVTIQLELAPDGRVTGSKITQRSGIPAMDESVARMLSQLDRVAPPPRGVDSLEIVLQTE